MEEAAKETVIIVHGTWAAPKPNECKWYQPPKDMPNTASFVAKLDAALKQRGSPARCWAHCKDGAPIFHWSGENNWIERSRAGVDLVHYVRKLRDDGWLCHIVAHSHGGNIVADVMRELTVPRLDVVRANSVATVYNVAGLSKRTYVYPGLVRPTINAIGRGGFDSLFAAVHYKFL